MILYSPQRKLSPFGEKIVSASDMALYERHLMEKDPSLCEKFMDIAALNLFHVLEQKVLCTFHPGRVVLLVGKGNNGGDAYALGALLLHSGFDVTAYQLFVETSQLSEKKAEAFEELDGVRVLISSADEIDFLENDLLIDGLLGTGCKGSVSGLLKDVIDRCNKSSAFVFSIDIPSGVDGNSGIVDGSAIYADMTGYLGALKIGHLFEDGYSHAGFLHYVDFGMETAGLQPYCYLVNASYIEQLFPKRGKKVHKYEVGEVSIIAGTNEMVGAGELSCLSAYRSGCGLVRHFYLGNSPCLVKEVISKKIQIDIIQKEFSRSKGLLIGPGLGRSDEAQSLVKTLLKIETIPIVIDGDALFLMDMPSQNAILTPHKGEILRLLGLDKEVTEDQILVNAQRYCDDNGVIIIYKGVPTIILSPGREKLVIVAGNPGMATAGSGDVLAGIVVSFLAQGLKPLEAAILSVTVHGKAGNIAAENLSERFMIASDIIDALSTLFLSIEG